MTDVRESEFMPVVRSYLSKRFPSAEKIESEVHLSTNRFVDFVVYFNGFEIMVEVEDRAEDVVEGVAQAQMYSWSSRTALGMVIYPEGIGSLQPEVVGMNPAVSIVAIDSEKHG